MNFYVGVKIQIIEILFSVLKEISYIKMVENIVFHVHEYVSKPAAFSNR